MSSHQRQHDIIFITAIQMKGWCRFSENATTATCAEAISSNSLCLAISWKSHIYVTEVDPDNLFISGETQKNLSPFIKFHFWQRRLNINDYINLFSASALLLSSFHEVRWIQLSCSLRLCFYTTWWKWGISKWTTFSSGSCTNKSLRSTFLVFIPPASAS